ncbi:MAG: AAA family ATPase [Actinobacteria bacterium]|nr:AAA family ATPase [Actinomycetota bacterium]
MTCPSCGQENPAGFKFCGACGAPLAEPGSAEAEERKLVSVLFVDLVGHTAASDRADPEDVRARLRPYHQLLKREIERYGGTVEKFVGDAVMAVFGAPVTHEDDAERAVRSALRILEAVDELELEVRAAIATGEAVVTLAARPEQGEGIVAGDVVNTASRLQQEAAPGTLVVGEVTYRATRDAIEYEVLDPVSVKGKAEPVPLWRALRARARFGVDAEAAPRTPFVGREHDLRLLTDTFERVLRETSIQLVTVAGDPGVGKTRLVAELRSWLDDRPERVRWRQGRCLPYGEGITFWALGEIVKAEAGILESDSPEQAATRLQAAVEAAVDDPSEHGWFVARLAPLVGAEIAPSAAVIEREESFTAWRRFLEGLASQRPLVIVIEDLHWADVALLKFLDHLVGWGTELPLMLVCTARPELYARRPEWGGGRRNSATISLSPLSNEDTARLIAALLSQAVLPAETQTALLERCGGNPLYAEEFVRMLDDRGILVRKGETVELATDGDISVPETVQALIAARLDTLSAPRKALVHDAAVMGKVFWAGAAAAIGRIDDRAAREGLQELVERGFVRPARTSSMEHQTEYSFWHVLIRDVAYDQIPRRSRLQKHEAAAGWIEQISGDRVTDQAEFLAHHYGQALELARAVGAEEKRAELEDRTRRFLVLAGDRAIRLDVAAAQSYYRRGLELAPPGDPDRGALLLKTGEAAYQAGDLEDAERLSREALEEARGREDRILEGEAGVRLSNLIWFRGERERAWNALVAAVDLLGQEPPGPELARAHAQMARDLMLAERSSEAVEAAERALELARPAGLDEVVAFALQVRGSARCSLDDYGGLEDLGEGRRMALELELGHEIVRSANNLGSHVWPMEGPAAAHELFATSVDLGLRRGLTSWVRGGQAHMLWTLFDLGRWDELLDIADDLISWDETHGQTYWGPWGLSYKAHVLVRRGQHARAAELEPELLARAREIGDPQVLAPALVTAALIRQAHGELDAALELATALEEATPSAQFRTTYLSEAVRVCVAAGASEQAASLVAGTEMSTPRSRHAVLTARAVIAEAAGRFDEALQLYGDATRGWAEFGCVLEQGQTLLGRARCLVALGRRDEAREPLTEARSIFARLGATPLADEVDRLLAQAA